MGCCLLVFGVGDKVVDSKRQASYLSYRQQSTTTTKHDKQDAVRVGKWARGPWAGGAAEEAAVRSETGAVLRCLPLLQPVALNNNYTTCIHTGFQATEVAVFSPRGTAFGGE